MTRQQGIMHIASLTHAIDVFSPRPSDVNHVFVGNGMAPLGPQVGRMGTSLFTAGVKADAGGYAYKSELGVTCEKAVQYATLGYP